MDLEDKSDSDAWLESSGDEKIEKKTEVRGLEETGRIVSNEMEIVTSDSDSDSFFADKKPKTTSGNKKSNIKDKDVLLSQGRVSNNFQDSNRIESRRNIPSYFRSELKKNALEKSKKRKRADSLKLFENDLNYESDEDMSCEEDIEENDQMEDDDVELPMDVNERKLYTRKLLQDNRKLYFINQGITSAKPYFTDYLGRNPAGIQGTKNFSTNYLSRVYDRVHQYRYRSSMEQIYAVFTPNEKKKLIEVVRQLKAENEPIHNIENVNWPKWEQVASMLEPWKPVRQKFPRSFVECYIAWRAIRLDTMKVKQSGRGYGTVKPNDLVWTKEDSALLETAVETYGICNWGNVMSYMKEHSKNINKEQLFYPLSCLRQYQYLDDSEIVNKLNFTHDEDETIRKLVELEGYNWKKIATLLYSALNIQRTPKQLKDRFLLYLEASKQENVPFSDEETLKVLLAAKAFTDIHGSDGKKKIQNKTTDVHNISERSPSPTISATPSAGVFLSPVVNKRGKKGRNMREEAPSWKGMEIHFPARKVVHVKSHFEKICGYTLYDPKKEKGKKNNE